MFASRSVTIHVLRGVIGFGLLAAMMLAPISSWWSVGLIPVALVALGGCPACWTMGLVETIFAPRDATTPHPAACCHAGVPAMDPDTGAIVGLQASENRGKRLNGVSPSDRAIRRR